MSIDNNLIYCLKERFYSNSNLTKFYNNKFLKLNMLISENRIKKQKRNNCQKNILKTYNRIRRFSNEIDRVMHTKGRCKRLAEQ